MYLILTLVLMAVGSYLAVFASIALLISGMLVIAAPCMLYRAVYKYITGAYPR